MPIVPGQTITATVTIGIASGSDTIWLFVSGAGPFNTIAGDAQATGDTITASTALLAGTATGAVPQPGVIVVGPGRPFPSPRLVKNAEARGEILVCFARVISGRAKSVSLFPGEAFGAATAGSSLAAVAATILPGNAAGEENLTDEELLLVLAEAA